MKDKVINLEDVIPGDILLFEACDTLGYLIAYLTDSDVEHSGFLYFDKENVRDKIVAKQVIHQTTPVLTVTPLTEEIVGRKVYVMRLEKKAKDETFDMSPVLEVGRGYLEKQVPYNWDQLGILAFHYLISVIPFSKRLQQELVREESLVTVVMDTFISCYQSMLKEGSMVCSQFVCACFDEAEGEDYKLRYKQGVDSRMFLKRMRAQSGVDEITIYPKDEISTSSEYLSLKDTEKDVYITRFSELFQQNDTYMLEENKDTEEFIGSFMTLTGQIGLYFCQTLIPEWQSVKEAALSEILDTLIQRVDAISSPADLKSNMANLLPVGVILP